jgi:hypothetical protein
VARFANGDCDAILLVGFKEKKDGKIGMGNGQGRY